MFFTNRNYKKNSARLLNICEELIEKYQTNNCIPSCKSDLLERIRSTVISAKAEITEWKDSDTDYIKIANNILAHTAFKLLASGRYHIYAGMLNPMSCAENLMDVYKASREYGVKMNLINEEERKEEYEYLLKCISEI